METDTWIERAIIQQLSYYDERYKHDYGGKEESTEALIADCAHLKDVTSDGSVSMLENLLGQHADIEDDVEQAAERLHDQGLLSEIRKEPVRAQRSGDVIGETTIWEPTEEGLAEAKQLNVAYSEAVTELTEESDEAANISLEEAKSVLREYGVILQHLPKEFLEMGEDESQ